MKGDFSRDVINRASKTGRIMFQQGHPLIDSDINEAFAALVENQRRIVQVLSKQKKLHGAIDGFTVEMSENDPKKLTISDGYYQVLGMVVESTGDVLLDGKVDPTNGETYHLFMVVTERELLLSERTGLSQSTSLRSGVGSQIATRFLIRPDDKLKERNPGDLDKELHPVPKIAMATSLEGIESMLPLRMEVHSLDKKENKITFKLAKFNASRVFRIRQEGEKGSLTTIPYQGDSPNVGEYLELESANDISKFDEESSSTEPDAALVKVTSAMIRDGISVDKFEGVVPDKDQVRVWDWVFESLKVEEEDNSPILRGQDDKAPNPFTIWIDENFANLREGDHWVIEKCPRLPKDTQEKEWTKDTVKGRNQPVYYVPLATVEWKDDKWNNVVSKEAASARDRIDRIASAASKSVQTGAPSASFDAVEQLPAHSIGRDIQNLGIRRFLASATLGEIANLSRSDLTSRLQEDCLEDELDQATLADDVGLILQRRQDLLANHATV